MENWSAGRGYRAGTGERAWPGTVRPLQWQLLSEKPELGKDLGALASGQRLRCQSLIDKDSAPTCPVLWLMSLLITLAATRPLPRQVYARQEEESVPRKRTPEVRASETPDFPL